MAPPKFDDLGKAASDLFKKGYEHGNVKFEIKSKSDNIEFTTKAAHNLSKSSISADVECNIKGIFEGIDLKKTTKSNGISDFELSKMIPNAGKCTVTGSLRRLCVNTSKNTHNDTRDLSSVINDFDIYRMHSINLRYQTYHRWYNKKKKKKIRVPRLFTEISLNNDGISGFKLGKFKQNYTNANINANLAATIVSKPIVNFDAVYAMKNINAGFALGYDIGSSKLLSSSMGASYTQDNLNLTLKSNCLQNEYNLLILQKAANNKTLAANINYAGNINMSLATKLANLKHGSSQHKINQDGIFTSSFTTKFDSGCEATFSSNVNVKDLQGPGHTIGAIFKFNL
jgi:hypothetical protein